MNEPSMFEPQKVTPDITSLIAYTPIPGFGVLPVNAFVVHAQEPVLVDTGMAALRQDFMTALKSVIDPEDIRWIWITHADMDHLGNYEAVLQAAPNARVVTTYMGMAKIGLQGFPLDRVFLLNAGQSLDVGDRKLLAIKPPTFDAPETTGIFDVSTSTLISADCFGAILDQPVDNASEIDPSQLRDGATIWASIDAPWLNLVDPAKFIATLKKIDELNANTILSSHLPVANNMCASLLAILENAYRAPTFVGPDQAMLEKMMAA